MGSQDFEESGSFAGKNCDTIMFYTDPARVADLVGRLSISVRCSLPNSGSSTVSQFRTQFPLEVRNALTETISNTITPIIDQSLHPLRDIGERSEQAEITRYTALVRSVDCIPQQVADIISPLLDEGINTLQNTIEREDKVYNKNVSEVIGNMPDRMIAAFRGMILDSNCYDTGKADLSKALKTQTVRLEALGTTLENIVKYRDETRYSEGPLEAQIIRKNTWVEAGRYFGVFVRFWIEVRPEWQH